MNATAADWTLVWSDEFDGSGLPDPSRWDYEVGFVRNRELQYYTKARPENARLEDGMLIIEGRKEPFANPKFSPNEKDPNRWQVTRAQADYTAASVITLGKAAWLYGRIEVCAKLPQGKGVWPAIWMLGANRAQVGWPACGEIDIMEFVGHTPDRIHSTVHYKGADGKHASSGGKLAVDRPFDDFHVYAVEWSAERLDFFFDQQKVHTFDLNQAGQGEENPFRKPQYLLLNLALGGSWGKEMDNTVLPQRFVIDYVRVYQPAAP
jgi:beta-glucanase (GH16 family)